MSVETCSCLNRTRNLKLLPSCKRDFGFCAKLCIVDWCLFVDVMGDPACPPLKLVRYAAYIGGSH